MKQLLILIFALIFNSLSAQTIRFVDHNATGASDGSSWANAYISLDAALTASVPGQQIWVSAGTYKPATSFLVQTGVAIYGGFAGTETALNQRNPSLNLTTLSGDLLGNDITGNFDMNRIDNVQHIVTVFSNTSSAAAVVDGFIFRGGHTLVGTPNADLTRRGAGILVGAKATMNPRMRASSQRNVIGMIAR